MKTIDLQQVEALLAKALALVHAESAQSGIRLLRLRNRLLRCQKDVMLLQPERYRAGKANLAVSMRKLKLPSAARPKASAKE
jgi:hypothetical protein